MSRDYHDPDANLDRTFDWSGWLPEGDAIATATVTSDDVNVTNVTFDETTVTCWVSGGTARTTAAVTCSVVTVAGRADDRTLRLWVTER